MNRAWSNRMLPVGLGRPKGSARTRDRKTSARLGAIFLAFIVMPSPGTTAPTLRIATWDVSQAEKSIFAVKKNEKKSSWRHTFGSERNDAKKTRLGVFNLDVDVVLLQGVRNVRALRRIFPTRHWKLILSKDYMRYAPPLSRLPSDLQAYDISVTGRTVEHPVTAIAVRYQRRLRVRGIQHIRIKDYIENADDSASGIDLDKAPSATAVRINYFGSNLWLMSAAFLPDCQSTAETCQAWKAINAWYKRLTRADHLSAIAGTAHTSGADINPDQKTPARCGELVPVTEICRGNKCLGKQKSLTRKKLGCIVMTRMRLPPTPIPTRMP